MKLNYNDLNLSDKDENEIITKINSLGKEKSFKMFGYDYLYNYCFNLEKMLKEAGPEMEGHLKSFRKKMVIAWYIYKTKN